MKLLRILYLTGELEAALRTRERAGQIALGEAHAARHEQDGADEVVAFVSDRSHVLARSCQTLPPRSRQLEQQNLFALDPSHRSGLRREPEAVLDLAVELQLASRSEEHTSELQSQSNLVCRLLLEKKNTRRCQRHA